MTQRTKLELSINRPTEIELLYDEPVIGKSQYGPYYMYALCSEGEEYTFFAPEEVHDELKQLRKGDRAVITKLASQRGNKVVTTYEVAVNTDKAESVKEVESPEPEDDGLYEIMLQSFKDAIKITNELNGMADPSKIAISLYISRTRSN